MVQDLQMMTKKRVAIKGWLSRYMNRAKEVISKETKEQSDIDVLKDLKKELESRLNSLDELQSDLELMFDDEVEMLEDIEKSGVFRDSVMEVISSVAKVVGSAEAGSVSGDSTRSQNVKLPKLDLPKFGGDVLKWQSFWEMFKASVHDTDLPDVTKFSYLHFRVVSECCQL